MIYIIHQERDRNYKIAAGLSVQRRLRRLDRLGKERERVGCLEVEMSYFFHWSRYVKYFDLSLQIDSKTIKTVAKLCLISRVKQF